MTMYPTTFVNKRSGRVRVYDGGKMICVVEPGEEKTEISSSPHTVYARYSRITYMPGERVEVKPNKDWECPHKGLTIELVNIDGQDEESFYINGDFATAYRGVPTIIPVDPHDPLARFSKIIWEKKPVQFEARGTDYLMEIEKVVKTKVPRPDKEWAVIQTQLKAEAETEHLRDMARKFGKPETPAAPEQA
jgi:hypothetical protein